MKKLWAILGIIICLIVSLPISVLADTNRITAYVDAYAVGTWTYEDDYFDDDGSLDGVIMGIDIPIGKFKIGFEYEDISYKVGDYQDLYDTTTSIAKGGFQVFGNDKVRVDLTLNYFEREYDGSIVSISGLLVGADGLWNISDRMSLQGSLGLSIDGKAEYEFYEEDDDAFIVVEKIKYNYMFTDNFGLGVGYNFISILFDDGADTTINTGGITAGITVRF